MISQIHPSWHPIVEEAMRALDPAYLKFLETDENYFPDRENLFNAFKTLPLEKARYILFGQDPYPRRESALGYAFIDGKVGRIFEQRGLSKAVNRATSLRNFIKMVLLCEGELKEDLSKEAIARIDTSKYIQSIHQLRQNFEKNGILLLNMGLIFTDKKESRKHIKAWRGFIASLLRSLQNRDISLILFGKAAAEIEQFTEAKGYEKMILPHPYNLSFITDERAHRLFGPMHLLNR
ncbi:MAG: uracil-DNA glycosylase [Campylobacteraceae bacterium 4484_4]|nr:MAG: uracil-DNA glycosylase [Campylobacteraceae bacterium 4484_4]